MDDVTVALDALGNPTRRQILDLLREDERSVRSLTEALEVSQPAVSQHLRVLSDARLVTHRPQGASNLYRIDRDGLHLVRRWVESFWDDALAAFVAFADREPHTDRPPRTDRDEQP